MIKEIKNRRQLKRLCVLPYDLTVDEPSPESVHHVIAFAKKTGDYLSLSSADIKVIALTYQLEKELMGTEHLRSDPVVARTIASRDKPAELIERAPLAGFYNPPSKVQLEERELATHGLDLGGVEKPLDLGDDDDVEEEAEEEAEEEEEDELSETEIELTESIANLDLTKDVDSILAPLKDASTRPDKEIDDGEVDDDEEDGKSDCFLFKSIELLYSSFFCADEDDEDDESASDEDESDLTSWITPANFVEVKSLYGKDAAEEQSVKVACMSTDYAIQNVLKQINLNIAALDGRVRIKY